MKTSRVVTLLVLALAAGTSAIAAESVPPTPSDRLRSAIKDLSSTFGGKYPGEKAFLDRLAAIEARLNSPDKATQDSAQADFTALQREALAANPLVSGQEIVFTVRPQYATFLHAIDTLFQAGEITYSRYARGGALKILDPATGKTRTLVETPDGTVRSPCVHFDAKKILFAMRRNPKENFHIFEINADGTGLRQLTCAAGVSDFDPFYLPDDNIVFSSTREPKFNMCSQDLGANLFRMDADGANIHQITKSTLFENQGSLMPDGRILYKRWEYVDRNFGDAHGFWTVYPDGTQQSILWGNNKADPAAVYYPRIIPGTSRLLCILGTHHGNMWGALGIIDPRIDIDRNASILRTWPDYVRRTLYDSDHFNCDRLGGVNPKYEDPFPLSDKYFLCSRMTPANRMGIYVIDTFGNEVLLHEEGPGCFGALPIVKSKRPPVIPTRRNFRDEPGTVYVANVYEGTHMQGVTNGAVKYLRIVEAPEKRGWCNGKWFGQGFQAPGMNWHDFTAKRILGTVPVEPDGSAFFRVPSDTFIYFQLLDRDGMMIQSMRSGTVVQSGEYAGCIGCHDNRLAAKPPESKVTKARGRAPSEITPWYGTSRSFSYQDEVQPVFNKYCVSCHDFGKPAGAKLNLAGDRDPFFCASYTELWRKRFIKVAGAGPAHIQQAYSWGAHASRLVKILREGHPAGSQGPSREQLKLDPESFNRIITWIDINAPYYPTYYTAFPENTGGRCPLDGGRIGRLNQITGINCAPDNFSNSNGPWISFDRPELSPCLAKLDPASAPYREALAIIREGRDILLKTPRGDSLKGFTPCPKDEERERYYNKRRQIELENRKAILEGRKIYDQKDG